MTGENKGGSSSDAERKLHISHCYALFADLFLQLDEIAEAGAALEKGFEASKKSNDVCDLAELQRLKGELLLQKSTANKAEAEASFRAAIETARQQNAKSWELRATMSLCRLLQSQEKHDEARSQLASVYESFTEGFDTPDLVDATTLLEELSQ